MASAEEGNGRESPLDFSRFNLKPIAPRVRQTVFGKIRAFSTFTSLEWVYLVLALVALTASMGITIQRLATLTIKESPGESDFTFAILLLLTILFCYHYVVHSVFTERWDELMVFVCSTLIVLIYCVVNYFNGDEKQPPEKMIRLIFVCTLSPFLIIAGIVQSVKYCRSNNLIQYSVGGITSLQNSCRIYFVCSSLLKFDLQLQLSMLILVMGQGVLNMSLRQKIILASGVPISILFFIIGCLGLRYESKPLMIVFYVLGLFEPGYIIYKFYYTLAHGRKDDPTYDATFVCGYFAAIIWICLILATVYFVICHFGKGLKERLFGDQLNSPQSRRTTESVFSEVPVTASEDH